MKYIVTRESKRYILFPLSDRQLLGNHERTCRVFRLRYIVRRVMHIQLLIEGQRDQHPQCIPRNIRS